MKKFILEKTEILWEEDKATSKQIDYIKSLMDKNDFLNNLAFNTRQRLTKKVASKLIATLIEGEEVSFS